MSSTRSRYLVAVASVLSVILFLQFIGQVSATSSTPLRTKGIVLGPEYVTHNLAGAPSLSQLKADGFTLVGVIAYQWFEAFHWQKVAGWIKSVHATGLTAFVNVRSDRNQPLALAAMVGLAANTGADVLALDEPISWSNMTQAQLEFTISSLESLHPNTRILINEYSNPQITDAYAWTAKYSKVSVATDDYDNKQTIDYGARLAQSYGKTPTAWLIFSKGSQNFDSYLHLDSWLTYVKQRNVDVLFWYIDAANTWESQWAKVAGF